MGPIIVTRAEQVFPYCQLNFLDFEASVSCQKGNCKGDIGTGKALSFDEGLRWLGTLVQEGKIQPRDFKVRYDGHTLEEQEGAWGPSCAVTLRCGMTHFYECKADMGRNEEDAAHLQRRGIERQGDAGFYFARGLGAAILTMTSDQKVVVGVRKSTEYDGMVHAAAGWCNFSPRIEEINPRQDAFRELQEELGIAPEDVEFMDLIGAVAYPKTGEVDMVYAAWTEKPAAYFASGAWKEAVDAREHKELLILSTPEEMDRLATEGKSPQDSRSLDVIASTKYGLEVLRDSYGRWGG